MAGIQDRMAVTVKTKTVQTDALLLTPVSDNTEKKTAQSLKLCEEFFF